MHAEIRVKGFGLLSLYIRHMGNVGLEMRSVIGGG